MKMKVVNGIIVFSVVMILSVLALFVRIGATADSVAVLRTTGMTCGSCSSKITKALESVKGVAATEVDVERGWVIIGYDTESVKPESLAEKVSGAGFTSKVAEVLSPERFQQITGRNVGEAPVPAKGCGGCGSKGGGCGGNNNN